MAITNIDESDLKKGLQHFGCNPFFHLFFDTTLFQNKLQRTEFGEG